MEGLLSTGPTLSRFKTLRICSGEVGALALAFEPGFFNNLCLVLSLLLIDIARGLKYFKGV